MDPKEGLEKWVTCILFNHYFRTMVLGFAFEKVRRIMLEIIQLVLNPCHMPSNFLHFSIYPKP